jgi:CRISPR-associated endonuclease Cas2
MNFFVSYDISDDKRRLHLSKLLLREGCKRLQKSVFIAIDFERKEMLQLKIRVDKLLNVQFTEGGNLDDSVLYIPLDNDAVSQVLWQGNPIKWAELWKIEIGKVL